MVEKTE